MTYGMMSPSGARRNSDSGGFLALHPRKPSPEVWKETKEYQGQCDGRRRMAPVRSTVLDPLYSLDSSEYATGSRLVGWLRRMDEAATEG